MNIIITGASSGIGYAVAKAFAASSSNKVIVIARSEASLKELASLHTNITSIFADIANDDLNKVVEEVKKQFNHVDILINNAGQLINKSFFETTKEDWQQMMNVNTIAPAMLINKLQVLIGGDKHTHIINIGSMGGFQGSSKFVGLSAYSASKAALANLTECLAEEFKAYNISVNCLALGSVQTEMLEKAFPGYKATLALEQLALFVLNFAETGHQLFNGKVLPVSISTP